MSECKIVILGIIKRVRQGSYTDTDCDILAEYVNKSELMRDALVRIRDKCQVAGQSFESQSFENTDTARKAICDANH